MKKLSLLICLTLVFGFAFSQWIQLNPELTNPQFQLNSVFFTDANTGFAVGKYESSEDYLPKGIILKTIDGGANWDTLWKDKTPENNSTLTSVFFTDANTGYVAGYDPMGGHHGIILKTIDGGLTWDSLELDVYYLNSVFFTDINTGYLAGSVSYFNSTDGRSYNGIILKTIDGGLTWDPLELDVTYLNSVFFTNTVTGYAVGSKSYHNSKGGISYDGIILKTIDGGVNWDPVCLDGGNFSSIYFPDANTGYVIDGSTMFKTVDVGATWTNLLLYDYSTNSYYYLNSLYFTNANTGYAVGRSGTIIKTIDGGITWTKLSSGTTNNLFSIFFSDYNTGYAVGGRGTILKTTNGGGFPTAIENVSQESTFTVYPNPATNKISIATKSNLQGETTICIYNINGAILQQEKFQSQNLIEMNVSAMAKGIYLLQIQTKAGVENKKLLVQ